MNKLFSIFILYLSKWPVMIVYFSGFELETPDIWWCWGKIMGNIKGINQAEKFLKFLFNELCEYIILYILNTFLMNVVFAMHFIESIFTSFLMNWSQFKKVTRGYNWTEHCIELNLKGSLSISDKVMNLILLFFDLKNILKEWKSWYQIQDLIWSL